MPYLQFLFCDKCGAPFSLDLDPVATINTYIEEGRESAFINSATIVWDYLIYFCERCKTKYKYGYRDVERKVREYLSAQGPEMRKRVDQMVGVEGRPLYNDSTLERIEKSYTQK